MMKKWSNSKRIQRNEIEKAKQAARTERTEATEKVKASYNSNKNTLTGPTSCKKTTRDYAHLSLCAKSRKTNDAKSIQKMAKNLNLGNFLTISRSNISKLQIFLKNRFHSNWRSYLVLTSGQKPKKLLEPFLRKISKCQILG